jgi:hypothetical protein
MIKQTLLLTVALLLSLSVFAQEEEIEVHDDWRLKKSSDGVKVYTRWIEADDTRKARQMLAQMEVKTNMQSIIDVIKDDEIAEKWVNRAKNFYNFESEGDNNWYTYTELSIPWPFSNKDLITRNELIYHPQEEKIEIKLIGEPDRLPEKKSVSRIPHFEGSWLLTQVDHQTVKIEYFIFTKQEPILPRFIIDPIVEGGIWTTLDKMRQYIIKRDQSIARADSRDNFSTGKKIATK